MKDILSAIDIWRKIQKILDRKQKILGILIFILTLIGSFMEMLGVSVILPLVQVMISPEKFRKITIINSICNLLKIENNSQLLILVVIGVILVYLLKNLYLVLLCYIRIKYSAKIQRELSIKMMNSYASRGFEFFRQTNTGNLMRGISGAVSGMYTTIYQCFKVIADIFSIICICIYVVVMDWMMAMCVVVLSVLCLFGMMKGFRKIIAKAGKKFYKYSALTNQHALQFFNGIKEVLVMDRKGYFTSSYIDSYVNMQKSQIKQNVAVESPTYIIEGVSIIGLMIAVCFRLYGMENPAAYVPQLSSFAVAAFRVLPSLGRLTSSFNTIIYSIPAINDMYSNVIEAEKYEKLQIQSKQSSNIEGMPIRFQNELEIRDIVWRYTDGTQNVLNHISMTINKGQSVAFVGPSGAGKTTLADIVLGLFIPQEGKVLSDGYNIYDNLSAWARIIGFVPQSVYLIDDTIRRNIAFGIDDKKIDDTTVWRALEQAQMKQYVEALPQGIDTYVGERGIRFSGGQMQRLAIARALYTDPDILVLDEATSALDNETETAVMEAINALQGHKTLIIIAHRLTTIKNCDKIYEIAEGKARESTYEELI